MPAIHRIPDSLGSARDSRADFGDSPKSFVLSRRIRPLGGSPSAPRESPATAGRQCAPHFVIRHSSFACRAVASRLAVASCEGWLAKAGGASEIRWVPRRGTDFRAKEEISPKGRRIPFPLAVVTFAQPRRGLPHLVCHRWLAPPANFRPALRASGNILKSSYLSAIDGAGESRREEVNERVTQ